MYLKCMNMEVGMEMLHRTKQGQVVTSEIGKRNRADRDEGIVGLHDMGQRSLTYVLKSIHNL